MKSFAVALGCRLPRITDLHRLGHFHPDIFRDPGIEYVGGADAERHASDGADVWRVRIGTDVDLSGQRIGLEHHRVADAFGAFAVGQFAVQLDALRLGEVLLLELELRSEIEQSDFLFLFGDDLIKKGQVIAEEADTRGIVDLGVFADVALEEDRSHRRDVLVAEAEIDAREASVAGFHGCDAIVGSPTRASTGRAARLAA